MTIQQLHSLIHKGYISPLQIDGLKAYKIQQNTNLNLLGVDLPLHFVALKVSHLCQIQSWGPNLSPFDHHAVVYSVAQTQ